MIAAAMNTSFSVYNFPLNLILTRRSLDDGNIVVLMNQDAVLGSDPDLYIYGLGLSTCVRDTRVTNTHTFALGVQLYCLAGNLEVNQNGVFMAERTHCFKALVSILEMPTQ